MFEDIDTKIKGVFTTEDLLTYYDITESSGFMAQSLLGASTIFQKDLLTYPEILLALYNLCTLSASAFEEYVYHAMDILGGGSIEQEVVIDLVTKLHLPPSASLSSAAADQGNGEGEELLRKVKKVRLSPCRT